VGHNIFQNGATFINNSNDLQTWLGKLESNSNDISEKLLVAFSLVQQKYSFKTTLEKYLELYKFFAKKMD